MKVISLEAPLLNFWIAKSLGLPTLEDGQIKGAVRVTNAISGETESFQPTTDWSQAGPILEKNWYEIETMMNEWFGPRWAHMKDFRNDPLTWLMRGFVALNFGDEVEEWPPDVES